MFIHTDRYCDNPFYILCSNQLRCSSHGMNLSDAQPTSVISEEKISHYREIVKAQLKQSGGDTTRCSAVTMNFDHFKSCPLQQRVSGFASSECLRTRRILRVFCFPGRDRVQAQRSSPKSFL